MVILVVVVVVVVEPTMISISFAIISVVVELVI